MSKYNLIRNSIFTSSTYSGTGNRELTYNELESLYDGNTTISGVVLDTGDILFIDIDLGDRIKVDSLGVYINTVGDRATAFSGFTVYYKDIDNISYIELPKSYDNTTFYATNFPDIFAPRYVRLVFDGIQVEVYEAYIINDDYIVSFGQDGEMTSKFLDSTSDYSVIPIFNNDVIGTGPKTAYVVVDYEDFEADSCLLLSSSSSTGYKSVYDGVHIGRNFEDYSFEMGKLDNCSVKNNSIELTEVGLREDYSYSEIVIPLVEASSISAEDQGWGVHYNAWDWNNSGEIYAIGVDYGATDLKLFILNQNDLVWNYVSYMCIGSVGGYWSMMACLGDYIYVIINSAGKFGRFNTKGEDGNWEDLLVSPLGALSKSKWGICSDKERYIYMVVEHPSTDPQVKGFVRYDVFENTWTELSSEFYQCSGSSSATALSIVYNHTDNSVLLHSSRYDTNDSHDGYIQKYNIINDTWNTSWNTYFSAFTFNYSVVSYYGSYLVYGNGNRGVYVYNTISGKAEKLDMPYNLDTYDGINYLMCAPINNGNSVGLFMADFSEGSQTRNVCMLIDLGSTYQENREGFYTTPVLSMNDNLFSSFFYTDTETDINSSITFNDNSPVSTLMVRSSNIKPTVSRKFYYYYATGKYGSDDHYVAVVDIDTKIIDNKFLFIDLQSSSYQYVTMNTLIDHYDGTILICTRDYHTYYSSQYYSFTISRYNLKYNTIMYTLDLPDSNPNHQLFRFQAVDSTGSLWFYTEYELIHYSYDLATEIVNISEVNGDDFLYRMSVNNKNSTCWYTNKILNKLINVGFNGDMICSIPLSTPRNLCALDNGGCIVDDEGVNKFFIYDNSGNLNYSISYDQTLSITSIAQCLDDTENLSFWVLTSSSRTIRMNYDGDIICDVSVLEADSLRSFYGGVLIWSYSTLVTTSIDNYGDVISSIDLAGLNLNGGDTMPEPLSLSHEYVCEKNLHHLYDIEEDIGWDNTTWVEVPLTNHGLPSTKYHQFKFRLTGKGNNSPKINGLVIPIPVKITDIQPQSYKNLYIKTDYPITSVYKQYNSKLKCWWKN